MARTTADRNSLSPAVARSDAPCVDGSLVSGRNAVRSEGEAVTHDGLRLNSIQVLARIR